MSSSFLSPWGGKISILPAPISSSAASMSFYASCTHPSACVILAQPSIALPRKVFSQSLRHSGPHVNHGGQEGGVGEEESQVDGLTGGEGAAEKRKRAKRGTASGLTFLGLDFHVTITLIYILLSSYLRLFHVFYDTISITSLSMSSIAIYKHKVRMSGID